jgi:hypothetical protein
MTAQTKSTGFGSNAPAFMGQPAWLWLACAAVLAGAQIVTSLCYLTPDVCAYLSIARSLATTGTATNLGSPHLMYAVGYPFLISPAFLHDSFPFVLITLCHFALAVLYLVGTYVWVRRHAAEAAVPIALMALGNVIVLSIFRRALSEVLFLPVMIWLVNALAAIGNGTVSVRRALLTAGLLLGTLVIIRPTGILFAGGFGLQMLICVRRGEVTWRRACALTAAVVLPALVALPAMMALEQSRAAREGEFTNLDIFTRSPEHVPSDYPEQPLLPQCLEGLRVRIMEVGRLTLPGMFGSYAAFGTWLDVNMLLYVPLCVLLAAGWLRFVRRRLDAFALLFPFYVALHIYWPYSQSGRYFAPLLPLVYLCFWFALEGLGRRRLHVFATLVVAHIVVALGHWYFVDRPRALDDDRCWPEFQRVVAIIRSDPGLVEVGHDLEKAQLMLQYLLDRRVRQQVRGEQVDPQVTWLVVLPGTAIDEEFRQYTRFGPYTLLRRSPSASCAPRLD